MVPSARLFAALAQRSRESARRQRSRDLKVESLEPRLALATGLLSTLVSIRDESGQKLLAPGATADIAEGEQLTASVRLTRKPDSGITVSFKSLAPLEVAAPPTTLRFTKANWNQPQTVTFGSFQDNVRDGDHRVPVKVITAVARNPQRQAARKVWVESLDSGVVAAATPVTATQRGSLSGGGASGSVVGTYDAVTNRGTATLTVTMPTLNKVRDRVITVGYSLGVDNRVQIESLAGITASRFRWDATYRDVGNDRGLFGTVTVLQPTIGKSATAMMTAAAVPEAPSAVRHLAVAPTAVKELTVTWAPPSRGTATSYTVTMTTRPLNQGEATSKVFVTTTPSLTVGNLFPYDTFFFEVSASNSTGTGDTTVLSYSATTSFLAVASFTMNPTAMLAASDGSVWIGYEDSLVPTVVSNILNGVTQIPVPQNLPPQVRQYVLRDGAWEHRATILTEGVSYGLTEDKNGDIWTANNTTHQSWYGHLFPKSHTSGVVQRITSTGGSYGITETLDLAGGPLPETLITMPSGELYVSVYGKGLANGVIQGIAVHPGTSAVFTTSFGPYMHPIVSLAARDGELWALESVPSGRFWDVPSELSTHSVIRRIDLHNLSDQYFKWVSPGASAIALLPQTDSTTSSVAIADHHRVLRVTFNGKHLKHDGDMRLEGQVKSFSFAADGALWVASRGKFGAIKEQLFLSMISGLIGTAEEIIVEIEQALGNLPEPEGKPGFIQQIWTPWQPFVAGEKLEFPASTRMAAGVNAPLAAPISSGMWVRSGNEPLFLPSAPFRPHGLAAVFGPGPGQMTLAWEPPNANGGTEIVGYSVTAAQGGTVQSKLATGTSVTFDGLSLGDAPTYFTVTATNFLGESDAATLFINKSGNPIPDENTVVGISTDGEAVLSNGYVDDLKRRRWGLDGSGNTYSWEALGDTASGGMRVGNTLTWNGVTFDLASPNQPNVTWAAGQTIAVPQGAYSTLNLAGAGVNGSQQNQQMKLNFTDGSSVVWTQSFSDWCSPQNYGHEAIVSTQSYRDTASGGTNQTTNRIYGYSYTIPTGKTLASITLPKNANVCLLDVQMSNSTPVNLSGAYTSWGIANGKTQVANHKGFDGGGYYYYSGDLQSTITWSGATFQFGPVPNSKNGQNNFVQAKGQTISLPQGDYGWLYLAGAAANGSRQNQQMTLTFTDGSTDTWTQSFSDWCKPQNYAGESIIQMQPHWVNQVGNVHSQKNYVYGYAYQIPAGKTVASVKLPNNSNLGILGMALYGSPTPTVGVGIVTDGTPFTGGGFDGDGNAYSWEALGSSPTLAWNGVTFDLGSPNLPNSVLTNGQTIPVPQGAYTTLNLAGAAANGSQTNQPITLTFTDNSTVVWTQSFSDWCSPQNYGHEAIVSTQSYRDTASGGTNQTTNHVYGYSYTIPAGKTLASIAMPVNQNIRLLDIQMSTATSVNLSGAYTSWGIANGNTQVANKQGFDGGGYYYYSGNLQSSITWSGATFQFGPVPNSKNGQNNFVQAKGQTISLPQGDYGWLYLAGAGANGNRQNQQMTLTFTDGSTDTWTQSFSDWCSPQNYAGESIIQMQPNWVNQVGNVHSQTNYVYGYAYQIPAGKTLASVKLPNNTNNLGILGMSML